MSALADTTVGDTPVETTIGEELIRTFNDLREELISTLWYLLGNKDDALDMAQDAFLRCWRGLDSLGEVKNLRAWIFRVGVNAARDLQRSAWQRKVKSLSGSETMPTPVAETPLPTDIMEEREEMEQLQNALLQLREEEKEVFLLRQNGDLTYEEIAEIADRPVGTVKTQMRSALQKLRKVLCPES